MSDDARNPAPLSRRDLIRTAAAAGAGIMFSELGLPSEASAAPVGRAAATMIGVPFEPREVVRIGIVGTGLRGRSMLDEWLHVDAHLRDGGAPGGRVRITALCDIIPDKVRLAREAMREEGHTYDVAEYTAGDRDFENLCARDDVDFVYTATPWEWHVPVMLSAMSNARHCGTEVPAAYSLADLWKLVDASETSRRHCIMMENCNYGYNELLVLQMVRAGVFGDVFAGGAAYNHDLRRILFENKDEGLWRRRHHTLRDANLYPTHGLGPVAAYMDVERGDRFDHLVSMSTPELGLTRHRAATEPGDSPKFRERYVAGDLNRSLIRTAQGRVILLEHNVTSPRPYSRINSVQGTKGIFEDYPPRIYIEGQDGTERWGPIDAYRAEYEHPLWRRLGERARSAGHGGMDYVMAWRLVQCMREGLVPDMDVYDAAAWSAPVPLSQESVAGGSRPVPFPDFTRGAWRGARRSFVV